MNNYLYPYGSGHFGILGQPQNDSDYEGLYHGGECESSIPGQDFQRGPGPLDATHFQPIPEFGSENGGAQPEYVVDSTGSQLDLYTVYSDAGITYSGPVPTQAHEALESPDWLSTPDVIAMNTSFQEISNGVGTVQPPSAIAFAPPYNTQPPPVSSPFTMFQSLSIGNGSPPGYAPQQEFGLPPAGEMGKNVFYGDPPYVALALFSALKFQPVLIYSSDQQRYASSTTPPCLAPAIPVPRQTKTVVEILL
ncbi:hypothetical protein FGG08_004880 [Glutinoglossum americanum]|uniref:Uncharacterized protein n=1 Tax=Glutinoglossum americanum TaxID=1670608 RepID=A0A9P8L2B1_9PEZI|nr:hypothetical protein FGG08_004880 [Glutinoglossum americanum]